MDTITLPEPGTSTGPCLNPCRHRGCLSTREEANQRCAICDSSIGYATPFVDSIDGPVHETCARHAATVQIGAA